MKIDTWRLNALVNELLDQSDDFDVAVAKELYESLPEEKVWTTSFLFHSSTTKKSKEGLTNIGNISLDEKEEKSFEIGRSKGTYVGRWRVTKTRKAVSIEPRLENPLEPADSYELYFYRDGEVEFCKSVIKTIRFTIPLFFGHAVPAINFIRMEPWKTPRLIEKGKIEYV